LVDDLTTVQGNRVEMIHSGEVGRKAGPDITDVKLRLDGVVRTGDVEIHRQTSDWYHHEHQHNVEFNTVVLHLAMTGERSTVRREDNHWVDTLLLEDYLAELESLLKDLTESELARRQHVMKRPCFRDNPDDNDFYSPLEEVAEVWLAGRASKFRNTDKNRLLSELVGALGYARNHEAFMMLGRRLDFDQFEDVLATAESTDVVEGYLLGVAGFFDRISGTVNRTIYRRRSAWNHHFRSLDSLVNGKTNWTQAGVRPHSRPLRRWVLFGWASRELLRGGSSWNDFVGNRLPDLVEEGDSFKPFHRVLRSIFKFPGKNYWRHHYSLKDTFHDSVPSPVGTAWFDQLIMNVLLPLMYFRSVSSGNSSFRARIKEILRSFPARMDNRRTRRIQRQWGFESETYDWKNGFHQQGAVFLYKKGCKKDRCENCPLNISESNRQVRLFQTKR
jgi:hypothetical protein